MVQEIQEVSQTTLTLNPVSLNPVSLNQTALDQVPNQMAVSKLSAELSLQPTSEQLQLQPSLQPNLLPDSPSADSLPNSQFAIALFDLDRLRQVSEGCTEFEIELLTLFISDSQEHLEYLRRSLKDENYPQFYRHAHHLKGSSANVGANGIKAIAEALEQFAQMQQAESLEDLLSKLQLALSQVQRLLEWMQNQCDSAIA